MRYLLAVLSALLVSLAAAPAFAEAYVPAAAKPIVVAQNDVTAVQYFPQSANVAMIPPNDGTQQAAAPSSDIKKSIMWMNF